MQEQTSWSFTVVVQCYFTSEAQTPTYVEVLLFLFTHCRWMNTDRHSPATMRHSKLVHYVQNYRQTPHRCGCQNSTAALNSLHCFIRYILLMYAVSILVGLHGIAAGSSAGTILS